MFVADSMIEIKLKGGLIKRKDNFYYMNHDTDVHIDIGKYDAKFDDMYTGSSDKGSYLKNNKIKFI